MPKAAFQLTPSWRARAVLLTLAGCLVPTGLAFAQAGPRVKTTREETKIVSGHVSRAWVVMTAERGTVLDVIHVDGDPNQYRESNWYWVLLPRDEWGTQRAGWVSGRDVDPYPPADVVEAVAGRTSMAAGAPPESERVLIVRNAPVPGPVGPRPAAAASAPAVPPAAPGPASSSVVHFAFNKSDLTEAAKAELESAVAPLKASATGTASVAVEGHADWVGSEKYNDALGMARAEAVRKHLAATHGIPATQITVVSRGEHDPAASNDTVEGRAENRRVVIRIVAPQ